jgi:membrane-associated phospholipid phosphatase
MYMDVPYGSQTISHRQHTVMPGENFMVDYNEWLAVQRGANPTQALSYDPVRRYIRNGRDLGEYVHVDALYQAYLNACLILMGLKAPLDQGNPYRNSATMDAFGTFGGPHILSLVTEVATRALKAAWYQKWNVHRRIRPEAFSGRIHNHITGKAQYPINSEILNSRALDKVFSQTGGYLLPMAFPEGSPFHPAYPSGHATVAGACITILKAWFDESWVIPNPVVTNSDGTELLPYTGPAAASLTVGGELNKVAANIAFGRNCAGVHWRTDASGGMALGEEVAIGILKEQSKTYREKHSFTLTRLNGTTIQIGN